MSEIFHTVKDVTNPAVSCPRRLSAYREDVQEIKIRAVDIGSQKGLHIDRVYIQFENE